MRKIALNRVFGSKKLIKTILQLFIPAALQAAISIAVLYVDNFSLAALLENNGADAKTGLGIANTSLTFAIMILQGWLGGTSIMMAQYFGAKNYENTRKIAFYRIWSLLVLVLPFVIIFGTIPEQIVRWTSPPGTEAHHVEYATIYLLWNAWTFVPFVIAIALSASLQETKRTNISFIAAVVGMLTNIILDPIVILLNKDNPEGAIKFVAISTGIARIVQCFFIFIYIFKRKNDPINFYKNLSINFSLFKIVNKNAMFVFWNDFFYAIANLLIMMSLLFFNPSYHDAMTNLQLMIQFTVVIWPGMATACSVLVGAELGNGNLIKAKENSQILIAWGILVSISFSIILFIVSLWVNPILSPGKGNDVILTSMYMQWTIIPIILSQGVFSILYFTIRSGGSKLVILVDAAVMIIWSVVFASLTFTNNMSNMNPLLFLFAIESNQIVKAILSYIVYKKANWAIALTKKEQIIVDAETHGEFPI